MTKPGYRYVFLKKQSGSFYVFFYPPDGRSLLLRQLGRCALDPELDFTWNDAAYLCRLSRDD